MAGSSGLLLACVASVSFALAGCAGAASDSLPEPQPSPLEGAIAETLSASICADPAQIEMLALDATSVLGFRAADVLAFAAGVQETTLHWAEREGLALQPEMGTRVLRVELRPRGERARLVDPERDVIGHGLVCQPWLEIDVEVTLQSEDGAINDRFDATLYAQRPDVAFVHAQTVGAQLAGALTIRNTASEPRDAEPISLALRLAFSPHGVSGVVTSEWPTHATDFHEPPTESIELAYFGVARCEYAWQHAVPMDASVQGVRGDELLAREPRRELTITWQDGATSTGTLELRSDADGACVSDSDQVAAPTRSYAIPATLHIESDDGRLDVELAGALDAAPLDPSATTRVTLSATSRQPQPITPAELGFPLQSGEGYDELQVLITVDLTASGALAGDAQLVGIVNLPCEEPGEVPTFGDVCGQQSFVLERGTLR